MVAEWLVPESLVGCYASWRAAIALPLLSVLGMDVVGPVLWIQRCEGYEYGSPRSLNPRRRHRFDLVLEPVENQL